MAFFSETPASFKQVGRFSPQQMQGVQQQLGMGMGQNFSFDPIESQARRDFTTKTIPSIAERFTSLGGPSAQRSSSFAGSLGGAASNLESSLAALRSQHGLQQQGMFQNLLTTPTFDTLRMPREASGLESLLAPLASGLGLGLGQTGYSGLAGLGGRLFGGQQQQQQQPMGGMGQLSPQEMSMLRQILMKLGVQ